MTKKRHTYRFPSQRDEDDKDLLMYLAIENQRIGLDKFHLGQFGDAIARLAARVIKKRNWVGEYPDVALLRARVAEGLHEVTELRAYIAARNTARELDDQKEEGDAK